MFRNVSKIYRLSGVVWFKTGAQPSDPLEISGTNACTYFRIPLTPETLILGDNGRTFETTLGSVEVTYYIKMKNEYVP